MQKLLTVILTTLGCATFCPHHALALMFSAPKPTFAYTDASGKKQSVEVVDKYYPKKIVEPFAKPAGQELVNNYGFKKLPVSNPYEAPVGSVLVYGAKRAAGHVEIRTENGFVSDFRSKTPSRRPLLGVFAKS